MFFKVIDCIRWSTKHIKSWWGSGHGGWKQGQWGGRTEGIKASLKGFLKVKKVVKKICQGERKWSTVSNTADRPGNWSSESVTENSLTILVRAVSMEEQWQKPDLSKCKKERIGVERQ